MGMSQQGPADFNHPVPRGASGNWAGVWIVRAIHQIGDWMVSVIALIALIDGWIFGEITRIDAATVAEVRYKTKHEALNGSGKLDLHSVEFHCLRGSRLLYTDASSK